MCSTQSITNKTRDLEHRASDPGGRQRIRNQDDLAEGRDKQTSLEPDWNKQVENTDVHQANELFRKKQLFKVSNNFFLCSTIVGQVPGNHLKLKSWRFV